MKRKARRAAVKARERQKKKLIFLAGASIVLVILLVVVSVLFQSKPKYESDVDTLFLLEDGKVISVTVESFDESLYDKTALETYIDGLITSYNAQNGEDTIIQKAMTIENGVANLVLEYANAQVYEEFEGAELFHGTLSEALKAGYTFDGTYAKVTDGKPTEASATEFLETLDYKIAIVKANTKVQIDGEVWYVSVENIENLGTNWVSIKDGCQLELSALETDPFDGTEATESGDEVVSDDELVVGSESTEVIFDFGDEEIEESDQYSDVYTYIIYK